jgi:ferredoxin-NADP reductase
LVFGFEHVLSALVGVVLLLAVIALSLPWVRRRLRYESWHAMHLATYLALWLSFGHQLESGGDFANRSFYAYWYALNGVVVGIFFVYRFLRPFALWYRHRFTVDRVVRESPDTWSVYIGGHGMESFRFEPGQFANLHLLSRGLWAGHPFSFSHEYDGKHIRFTVKAMGDATQLIEHLTPGTHVLIDGPLGVFVPRRAATDKYLLIAGGVGITPLRAIAGALASQGADVVALYAVRTRAHTALLEEMTVLVPSLHVFFSQDDADVPAGAVRGRIDEAAIRRFVPDAAKRDAFICGPAPMMDEVTGTLRRVGVPARQIHSERFAF